MLRPLRLAVALLALSMATPAAHAQTDGGWGVDGGTERRDEIIRRYRLLLEARPDEGPIFDRLLQELGGGARFDRVVQDYAERMEEDPERLAYPLLLGHLLKHAERLEEAQEAYARAIEIAPDDPRGYRAIAGIHRALDERDEARAAYERALELAADDDTRVDVLRELADLAFEAREWDVASGYVEQILAIEDEPYTRAELAEIYLRYQRYEEALAQYEAIVDQSGRDTRARAIAIKDTGDVLALMGRTDEAMERYEQALRLVDEGHWLVREVEQRIIAAYRQEDRLEELVARYEEEWSRPSVRQLVLLASLYDELGREDDAVDAYRRAVDRDPRSVDTRLALIRVLERRGDMAEVVEHYRDLARIDRNDASLRFRLIDVYRRLGRRDDALAVLDDMAADFRDRAYVLIDIADRYQRFGRAEDALEAYERLVRVEPDEPDNHIALGEFHFMAGRRSEAERIWRRVLDLVSPPAQAHAMLGDVYGDHGLIEEAVIEYEEAMDLAPDDDMIVRALAKLYDDARRIPESLELWGALVERTDQEHIRAEGRSAMVRLYMALGTLQDVIPEYAERFEADPPDVEAGYFLGEAWLALDDEARAESVYDALLEAREDDLIALLALEDLYTAQHRHREAIDILLRVAEAHPSRAREYYHRLAELSLRLYDDAEAVRFAQLAVELNPDNAQAHARLGEIYRQMQDLESAVLSYRQALLLDPRAFAYYFDLADLLLAIDRPYDADALYQEVLVEANDEVQVLRAGRRSIQINQARDGLESLIGLLEPRLYDDDLGETYLKLLVELYDRLTAPLSQTAEFGAPDERARARARLDDVGRRALRPLLDALASEDMVLRRAALGILSAQANPNAALPIARLIDSADQDIQVQAALAVARIGDPRASVPLLRAASDARGTVQTLAVWALARAPDASVSESLAALVRDGGMAPELRALAMLGLGRLPAETRPDGAIRDGLSSDSSLVQTAALLAAAEAGLEDVAEDARLLLAHGQGAVPLAAARALGSFTPTDASVSALAQAYVQGTSDIREHAGRALRVIGRAEPDTGALARYDRSLVFYDRSVDSFDVSQYLDGLLSEEMVRAGAGPSVLPSHGDVLAEALLWGLRGDVRLQSTLLDRLVVDGACGLRGVGEADDGVSAWVEAWVSTVSEDVVALASSGEPSVRAGALRLLGAAQLESARSVLEAGVEDGADAVSEAAMVGLARLGGAASASALLGPLRGPSWRRRASAARALGALGAPDALAALRRAADEDEYVSVRAAALLAIHRIAPDEGDERIAAAWGELPAPIRVDFAARVANSDAWPRTRAAALDDPDPRVRIAAGGRG